MCRFYVWKQAAKALIISALGFMSRVPVYNIFYTFEIWVFGLISHLSKQKKLGLLAKNRF